MGEPFGGRGPAGLPLGALAPAGGAQHREVDRAAQPPALALLRCRRRRRRRQPGRSLCLAHFLPPHPLRRRRPAGPRLQPPEPARPGCSRGRVPAVAGRGAAAWAVAAARGGGRGVAPARGWRGGCRVEAGIPRSQGEDHGPVSVINPCLMCHCCCRLPPRPARPLHPMPPGPTCSLSPAPPTPPQWRHAFASPADFIRTVRVEREAHGGAAVTALSAAPSGGLLLSAGADGSLLLWDLSPCCAPASGGGPAALRPRLLCQARHPSPLVWAQLLSPEAALAATAAAAFVWRVERPEAAAAAGGSRAGAGSEPGPPSFRLLRRFALEGGATCAAAWDQFVAVGCGEPRSSCSMPATGGQTCRLLCHAHGWRWGPRYRPGPGSAGPHESRLARPSFLRFTVYYLLAVPMPPPAGDGAVRVYDTYSGSCAKLLRLHQGGVAALQHVRHGELDLLVRWAGPPCAVLARACMCRGAPRRPLQAPCPGAPPCCGAMRLAGELRLAGWAVDCPHCVLAPLGLPHSGGADSRLLICDSDSTLTLAEAHLLRGGARAAGARLLPRSGTPSCGVLCDGVLQRPAGARPALPDPAATPLLCFLPVRCQA